MHCPHRFFRVLWLSGLGHSRRDREDLLYSALVSDAYRKESINLRGRRPGQKSTKKEEAEKTETVVLPLSTSTSPGTVQILRHAQTWWRAGFASEPPDGVERERINREEP
jgi:hypothetical protein